MGGWAAPINQKSGVHEHGAVLQDLAHRDSQHVLRALQSRLARKCSAISKLQYCAPPNLHSCHQQQRGCMSPDKCDLACGLVSKSCILKGQQALSTRARLVKPLFALLQDA